MATTTGELRQRVHPAIPAGTGRRRPWRGQGWWLLPPIALAVLGGWLLARKHGLWYDELYTAEVAPLAVTDLFHALVRGEGTISYLRDAPPSYNGPYYAVVHLWLAVTGLRPDEWGLRLPSLLASVGAVAVFTRAVGRLAGQRTAVVAGLVAATNPFIVQFSAEARSYGFALLATALTALGLARWLDGRPRALVLFGVAGAAAGLAHWFALLVVVALALAALALRGRRAIPVLLAAGAATLPAVTVVAIAIANGVGASGAEWISDVGGAVPRLLLKSWAAGNVALAVITLVAASAGLLLARRTEGTRDVRFVAAAWVGLPVVAVTALEVVRPVFVDRYLLPALLGLAVLVAIGITTAPRRIAPVALVAVLGMSVATTIGDVRLGPKEDVRGAVAAVAAAHRPGEPVVAAARWDALGLDHHARRDHPALVPDLVLPPEAVPPAPTVWVVRRAKGGVKGDRTKLEALDAELGGRGLHLAGERRFPGRYSDVLVQRWEGPAR